MHTEVNFRKRKSSMTPSPRGRWSSLFAAVAALLLGTSSLAEAQVINEFVANHTGTDSYEYIEVFGTANTNYSNLWVVQIEGDSEDGPGNLDTAYQVGTTDGSGLWVTDFRTNELHNGSATLLLVSDFTGAINTDLDTNDDGVLDSAPWGQIYDGVAVSDAGASDFNYGSSTVLTRGYDGIQYTPGGASRIPDGTDTDSVSDWVRNDYSGDGLPGMNGSLGQNEASNTPGTPNVAWEPPASAAGFPIISEFVANHTGNDTYEFIEIFGQKQTSYGNASIVVLEGDGGENPGQVDGVYSVGSTDIAGFWSTGFMTNALEDGSLTILLADGFTGAVGDDLDPDDNGTFNSSPWSGLLDSVAILDGGSGDRAYSSAVLSAGYDGLPDAPGGASRIPYYRDTDARSDWFRNDFAGEGLGGSGAGVDPGEAINTPAMVNRVSQVDYYAAVDASNASALRTTLHEAIKDHIHYPYSSSATDTWNLLEKADEDPSDPGRVLSVYSNDTFGKTGGGSGPYNREHSWPRSYGFKSQGDSNLPHDDAHHLFISDTGYNSARGSRPFGLCSSGCSEEPTVYNNGQGGQGGGYPGDSSWRTNTDGPSGIYEVWMGRRGDIARAMFYMDVRYEGDTHAVTGVSEHQLELTDDMSLLHNSTSNYSPAYMGRLSVLLDWHEQDPVDAYEQNRNDAVYTYQGNRNPFVDHPEWVGVLYGVSTQTVRTN